MKKHTHSALGSFQSMQGFVKGLNSDFVILKWLIGGLGREQPELSLS